MVRWPAKPVPPPIMQRLPMVVLPATPTQAASALWAPMCTLCPICTRLSSFTPFLDHGVVDGAAVDGGVGTDLDVRSNAHRAQLRHLQPGAALGREAEAVAADHHPGLQHGARTDLHRAAQRHARHQPHVGGEGYAHPPGCSADR